MFNVQGSYIYNTSKKNNDENYVHDIFLDE